MGLIDKIRAEVEKKTHGEQGYSSGDAECGYRDCARDILSFLNTLEGKEVDLEKAINGLTSGWIEGEEYGELQNINTACCVTLEEVKEAMRCIYELGLMHRKDNLYGNKY